MRQVDHPPDAGRSGEADGGNRAAQRGVPAELVAAHRLGVAFQEHALLPWLSAWDNIALPFRVMGAKPDADRISSLIRLVGLSGFERPDPNSCPAVCGSGSP